MQNLLFSATQNPAPLEPLIGSHLLLTNHQSFVAMDAHIKNWFKGLSQSAVESGRDFVRPSADLTLEEQLRNFFDSLPQRLLERPWTMTEITDKLVGKYRAHPHPQHVAQALRTLGWVQKRDWTSSGRGRRYWSSTSLRL